jgi:5-methylcytosine-specific restriction endonuclease McrA
MPLSRFGRRHKKTFGKKKEKWDGNFRLPPKPDSYYVQKKGICRWCGKKIIENKKHNTRKTWHQDCATDYMIIYHSTEARKHIWKRDKGKCNGCGKQCTRRGWDLDHVKPLMEQKGLKEQELDWSYYKLNNMQTLCRPCHKKKTKQDMKNNA